MAKYVANVAVISETNLPALFYFKYLSESYSKDVKYPPIQYYDEIDKKGLDDYFNRLIQQPDEEYGETLYMFEEMIEEFTKTVWHGFSFDVVHENVKDEGLAKKQAQAISKMIKNHEAPYNDIFKKYSVTIIQG